MADIPFLQALSISKIFPGTQSSGVRQTNLVIDQGMITAIIGESGSGKSVTAMALTKLLPEPPAVYQAGEILLDGQSILKLNEKTGDVTGKRRSSQAAR